ncbi:MAG: class I SAM-dependent methyltransferase [Desulfovibrionaceae bacterium]|nr:class I SAM-dependent methyltransferase [Desulfovibrionaceae bacterium]
MLKSLPEARWGEAGLANTIDHCGLLAPVLDRFAPRDAHTILDLGCGLGQTTRSLAVRYPRARVVGLDSSKEALEVAENAFCLPNLSFCLADLAQPLDFPRGTIDCIVSTNALPYALDALGTARDLFGLLTPEGLMLNLCRVEESHFFYDFPHSLLLPANTQLFVSDWVRAASQAGCGTQLWGAPSSLSPAYYTARGSQPFAGALEAYATAHGQDGLREYDYYYSHALLAHGAHVPRMQGPEAVGMVNHLLYLDQILSSTVQMPVELQYLAIAAWLDNARSLSLYPEALDFMKQLLPYSEGLIHAALAPSFRKEANSSNRARRGS